MRKHIPILLGLGLLLSGCATTSPLKQYYTDFCKEDKVPKAFRNVTPKILLSKHIAADIQKRRLAGESLLGVMEMTVAQPPTIQDVKDYGRELGATLILVQSRPGTPNNMAVPPGFNDLSIAFLRANFSSISR